VDYLNDKYDLGIPEGEYHTLGGYIFAEHESIPMGGEIITIHQFTFTIISLTNTRINEVKLELLA
jgi:putative hemolysin